MIGNEKPQKDSGPFWIVLLEDQHLCETWIRGETLNQGDKLGGLGLNLGLRGSRLRQVVAWDCRSNGPQKTESPAPSICLSASVREEERVNISLGSGGALGVELGSPVLWGRRDSFVCISPKAE